MSKNIKVVSTRDYDEVIEAAGKYVAVSAQAVTTAVNSFFISLFLIVIASILADAGSVSRY